MVHVSSKIKMNILGAGSFLGVRYNNGVAPHQSCSQCLAQRIGMSLPVAPNWTPVSLTFLARTGTHPVPETLCFYVFKASTATEYNKIFWG